MPLPQSLGRLSLARPLGADAVALTGLYVDHATGQYVVVRTLPDARASDPAAREAFRRGAYAGGPVLGTGELPDGTPYVVAPYAGPPSTPPSTPPSAPPAFAAGPPTFGPPAAYPSPPKPRRSRWPILAAVAVVLLLVAGGVTALVLHRGDDTTAASGGTSDTEKATQGSTDPSASPSTDPALGPDAPHAGECRNVPDSVIDDLSDSTPTISCQQPHKAYTFYVGRYRGDTVDNDYAARECLRRVSTTLGTTEAKAKLTAYSTIFFQPTDAQWAAGARWFRCDLAIPAPGPSLRPLPLGEILLPDPLPDRLAACRTATREQTPCNEPHAYRAYSTFAISGTGPTPPPDPVLQAQGRLGCPKPPPAYLTWPSQATWKYGDRIGVCWR